MSNDELLRRVQALELDNARLRRSLERYGSTAGLRHQVRNTLAMVRDIVRQSAETSDSVEDYAAHLEGRLDAVFRIQNTIANGVLDGINLHTLVMDELSALAFVESGRVGIEGPDVILQPAAASAFALAVHELATNAIKFGALAVPGGKLAVTWSMVPDDDGRLRLTLDWVESGMSDQPSSPPRRGFGMEMIEHALPYQLGGEASFAFTPTGIRCAIRLPMTPWTGSLRATPDTDPFDPEPLRA